MESCVGGSEEEMCGEELGVRSVACEEDIIVVLRQVCGCMEGLADESSEETVSL